MLDDDPAAVVEVGLLDKEAEGVFGFLELTVSSGIVELLVLVAKFFVGLVIPMPLVVVLVSFEFSGKMIFD